MVAMNDVGGRLRTFRRARALTQRDLHQRSGVAVSTIVAIERGEVDPQIQTIRKLAHALDVTPERLMVGEDL
jgi:transcriptional regulator with XRE-family HTH domain